MMQDSGLSISSFTWNGKRHMTPGGIIEYTITMDTVEVLIESHRHIKLSDYLATGTLQLILRYKGKKERVSIEDAFVREYDPCMLCSSGPEVTRIIFLAPPSKNDPSFVRDVFASMSWEEYVDYAYC